MSFEGVVVPARRKADADHVDRGIDRLQCVVGRREQRLVGGPRQIGPGGAELRLPEARLVWLVADHVVLHERIRTRELLEEGRELGNPGGRRGDVARMRRRDREEDADGVDRRLWEPVIEARLVGNRRRLGGVPVDRDSVLGCAEVVEGRVEHRRIAQGAGVLGDPKGDIRGRPPTQSERGASATGDEQTLSHRRSLSSSAA